MISVNVANIRSAEADEAAGSHWVTIRFGNNDRVTIYARSKDQASAIAAAINGASHAHMREGSR